MLIPRTLALLIALLISTTRCDAQTPLFRQPPRPNQYPITGIHDVINVLDYGAVCNGTTNDTVAIQNALNAAAANKGPGIGGVVTGRGTCLVTFTQATSNTCALIVPSNVTMVGAGDWVITANTNTTAIDGTNRGILCVGTSDAATTTTHVRITGLVLDGQAVVPIDIAEWGNVIALMKATDVEVDNNELRNFRGDGVTHCRARIGAGQDDVSNVRVHNNYIHHGLGQAVSMGAASTCTDTGWVITANRITTTNNASGAAETFILSSFSSEVLIDSNTLDDWGSITLLGATKVQIVNNVLNPGGGGQGCIVAGDQNSLGTSDLFIGYNRCDYSRQNNAGQGINIGSDLADRVTITGNTIKRNAAFSGSGGIARFSNAAATFTGTVISDNLIYGGDGTSSPGASFPDIFVSAHSGGTGTDAVVRGNICKSIKTQCIIVANINNTVIDGNVAEDGGIAAEDLIGVVIANNVITDTHVTYGTGGAEALFALNTTSCNINDNIVNMNVAAAAGINVRRTVGSPSCIVSSNRVDMTGGSTPIHFNEQSTTGVNTWRDNIALTATPNYAVTNSSFVRDLDNAIVYAEMNSWTTPKNGSQVFCADCTVANPCAAGGTGALAKRLNGAWVCN